MRFRLTRHVNCKLKHLRIFCFILVSLCTVLLVHDTLPNPSSRFEKGLVFPLPQHVCKQKSNAWECLVNLLGAFIGCIYWAIYSCLVTHLFITTACRTGEKERKTRHFLGKKSRLSQVIV